MTELHWRSYAKPKRALQLVVGLTVLAWLSTAIGFVLAVSLPSLDSRLTSRPERAVILGLKGIQGLGADNLDRFTSDTSDGGVILGSYKGRLLSSSRVTYTLNLRNIRHFVANARQWNSRVAIYEWALPRSYLTKGTLELYVDGHLRVNARLDARTRPVGEPPFFRAAKSAMRMEPVPFATDYSPLCLVVPLDATDLAHDSLEVTLETHGRSTLWWVSSVSTYTTFVPQNSAFFDDRLRTRILAFVVASALVALITFILARITGVAGVTGLAVAVVTLVLAIVTKDPWDLRVWQQLLDIAAFGGGSPLYAWAGTPLWAFLPGVLSPIVAFWNDAFGKVPQIVDIISLKLALWVAFGFVVIQLVGLAPAAWKRLVLLAWLVSPFSLYLISWGVRDLVSTALALFGLKLCLTKRLVSAAFLLSAATSVDEYFAPLLILPAVVFILTRKRSFSASLEAVILAAFPFALIVAQWVVLGAHYASGVLGYRMGVTFMDSTWQFLLNSAGLLPSFIVDHEVFAFMVLYLVLSSVFVIRIAKLVLGSRVYTNASAFISALQPLCGCVAAFFLSYGQADFQEWFGLVALLQIIAFRRPGLCWLVLTFLLAAGLELYAHVGLREFLNPAFFRLDYMGIWNTRGPVDHILIATCLALIVAAMWALATRQYNHLWGRSSASVLLAWFASLLSVSVDPLFSDLILIGCAFVAMTCLMGALGAAQAAELLVNPKLFCWLAAVLILTAIVPINLWAISIVALVFLVDHRIRRAVGAFAALDWVLISSAVVVEVAAPIRVAFLSAPSGVSLVWTSICALLLLTSAYVVSRGAEILLVLRIEEPATYARVGAGALREQPPASIS